MLSMEISCNLKNWSGEVASDQSASTWGPVEIYKLSWLFIAFINMELKWFMVYEQ